ncbi:MAG: hypothetical protein QXM43_08340 [Desulfurococcaceae archaeon]
MKLAARGLTELNMLRALSYPLVGALLEHQDLRRTPGNEQYVGSSSNTL